MIKRVNRGRYHSYVDLDTGKTVPGVTTILDKGLPKPALINWAANVTADYAIDHWDELSDEPSSVRIKKLKDARWGEKDNAARRGTEVHKLGEQLVAGHEVEVPEALAGHVDAYVRFLDEWDIQPVVIEAVVVNYTRGYAGTLDLIADIPHLKQRALLDLKTGRSGIWPETALQMAAYRNAEFYRTSNTSPEQPMIKVDRCYAVHVRADGYSVIPVETGPPVFRSFLYCQQVAAWTDDASQTVIGEALAIPQGAA